MAAIAACLGAASCGDGVAPAPSPFLAGLQSAPSGIALDGSHVYWTDVGTGMDGTGMDGTVMRLPLGGGKPAIVARDQREPIAIAVDAAGVYWTNLGGTVMKAPLGGGEPVTLASGQSYPYAIALDAADVYWTNQFSTNAVMKVPIAGGEPVVVVQSPTAESRGIAVDATNVYWTVGRGRGSVMMAALEDGTPTTLASKIDRPFAVAVDATSVYWTTEGGSVMKVSIDGGDPVTLAVNERVVDPVKLVATANAAWGIALDGTYVYWTCQDGTVRKTTLEGGGPVTVLASTKGTPRDLAIDAASVYFTDSTNGTVTKVAK